MQLRIEPLDTLFFRDGKPFALGEETWADGFLLPPPSVVYGALRTAIAAQNELPFAKVHDLLNTDQFRVTGLTYLLNDIAVLPLPADMVEYEKDDNINIAEKGDKRYEVHLLKLCELSGIVSKSTKKDKHIFLPKEGERPDEFENGFIVSTELTKYLQGNLTETKAIKLTDYVKNEPKVGNGRNDQSRSVEEGLLYRVDMKRSDSIQIQVACELSDQYALDTALVRLGGEGKLAQISKVRLPQTILESPVEFADNRFKIYFSTPALLKEKDGVPDLSKLGIDAELVASCVGKPVFIGGYDMVKNEPKPMWKAVPAGSVFYYQAKSDVSLLHQKQGHSLSDERAAEGFGIAYFGAW